MANIEVFISASSLGSGVISASFYYNECGNENLILTSSSGTDTEFSRAEFLNGITLSVPAEASTIHVKPTNKECRAYENSVITLS